MSSRPWCTSRYIRRAHPGGRRGGSVTIHCLLARIRPAADVLSEEAVFGSSTGPVTTSNLAATGWLTAIAITFVVSAGAGRSSSRRSG